MRASKSVKPIFFTWIDEIGMEELARRLKIDRSTVSHWKRGHCWPRVRQMREIRKMSKGRVTYEDIIDGGGR